MFFVLYDGINRNAKIEIAIRDGLSLTIPCLGAIRGSPLLPPDFHLELLRALTHTYKHFGLSNMR